MAGGEDGNIVDGDEHLNQPITHLQFNALRDYLRREFRTDLEAMEEKQDQMTEELQQLMRNVNDQLHQNMTAMRANLVAEIVREFRQVPEYTSAHGGEQRGTNEDAAAPKARERRHHAAPYAERPPGFGRGDNGDAAGQGLGRGHRRANLHIEDSE